MICTLVRVFGEGSGKVLLINGRPEVCATFSPSGRYWQVIQHEDVEAAKAGRHEETVNLRLIYIA